MANFDVTQYKRHLEIQNISGSVDASAPGGGVYLFSSGSAGAARLYLQLEGDSHAEAIDLAAGSLLGIAGDSGTGEIDLSAGQSLTVDTGDGLSAAASGQAITISVDAGGITNDMLSGSIASTKIAELNNFDTDDLAEGSTNLYYLDSRARAAVSADGDLVSYDSSTGAFSTVAANFSGSWDVKMAAADTGDLAEGSNLYYTDARARASVSVNDAGGDGSLSYDNSTGVFTFTGPSAAEVRAHFSGGTGIDITDGVVSEALSEVPGGSNIDPANDQLVFLDASESNAAGRDSVVDFMSAVAGDGLGAASGVLAVQVDDSSIELDSDALRVKAAGITNDMLSGSIASTKIAELNNFDTDDLAEGSSNLYYLDSRARAAISVSDVSGDGSLSYDSSTGVISYTGPSAAEVRAHFSADGDLVSYDSSTGAFSTVAANLSASWDVKMAAADTGDLAEGSNLYYTDARVHAAVSVADTAEIDMSYDGSGQFSAELRDASIANARLVNDSVTVTAGDGLKGGGEVDLGAAVTLNIEPADFAGAGLEDDGSDNLRIKAAGVTNDMLSGSIASTKIAELNNFDTDDLAEGSSNLYYLDSRARAAISVNDVSGDGSLSYDSSTGVISYTGPSAAEVRAHFSADGDLISYDSSTGAFASLPANFSASWDVKMAAADTGDLAEGSNLYYTDARVHAAVSVADSTSIDMSYDGSGQFSAVAIVDDSSIEIDGTNGLQVKAAGITNDMLSGSIASTKIAELNNFDTDDLAEGASNLYFTEARARASVSVTDAGGDGSLAYDSSTGVITYTGPSAAEVRAHFSVADTDEVDMSLADGQFSAVLKDGSVANARLVNDSVTLTAGAGMAAIGEVDLGSSITVAVDGVLEDLDTLGAPAADGEFIVATGAGAFAYESGDTARTSLGLGTGDSPEFTGVSISGLTAGRIPFVGAGGALEDEANLQYVSSMDAIVLDGHFSGSGNLQMAGGLIIEGGAGFSGSMNVEGSVTIGGGYGSTGVSITDAGRVFIDGTLTVDENVQFGADGAGADFVVYGADSGERMQWVSSEAALAFVNAGGTIMNLGGDASSDFAIDVANGSDNINKIRAAAFVTYSDESLKTEVQTMDTALDTIMSLNGVEFTWKNNGERDFGFIAQEVAEVLPKAVHTNEGISGVDYSRLTSVLVEAVKAQQVQIEDLKKALKK
jgi:hypothetical protein